MLTKRLSADEARSVQPVRWRNAAGGLASKAELKASDGGNASILHLRPEEQVPILNARLAALEAELERRVRETRETAYREGEAVGRSQATAQLQPVLEKLARSIHEVAELRPRLRQEAESDLLKLSLAIAKKILHRELNMDPDSIAGLIKVSIEKMRMQEIVKVRTHPQHQAMVQQMVARLSNGVQVDVLSDPKLELGGIVIETLRGEFDASVDLQLREIERGLTDHLVPRK